MSEETQAPEWPLAIQASRVADQPVELDAVADPSVRDALARRFGIVAIPELAAALTLRRRTDGDIAATARLRARVVQACVVTLDPVEQPLEVTVEGRFSDRLPAPAVGDRVVDIDPDDDSDETEPILDGALQLGEWLSQQLSLAIDPYPRKPGAAVDPGEPEGDEPAAAAPGPFARLAALRPDEDK